jgi:tRNA A-37 threonylcarbamoyl transferase component Bud32/tetratricopeptide (TPR) repeat protein
MNQTDLLEHIRRALHPRYEVERELGRSATGAVFLARDLSLRRRVAVKVLYPELSTESTARRFVREARILASLSHPNIVSIHETGQTDGLHYYVRDFLEGEPLSDLMARGPLSRGQAAQLCRDLLAALGAAHRVGVIHRDLRPENVFFLGDRFVLADFGIARPAVSADGSAAGTAAGPSGSSYAAPEQLTGDDVGSRSDLYVLAMLVYQAYTDRAWLSGSPVARAKWSRVPRRMRPVLRRGLAPTPAERWNDAAAFRDALDQAYSSTGAGRSWAYAGSALVLVGLIAAAFRGWASPGPPPLPLPRELAIVPLESEDGSPDSLGAGLAHLLQLNLDNLPGLSLTPSRQVQRWWVGHHGSLIGVEKAAAARDLRVHWLAHGILHRRGDSLQVRLTVYDAEGRKTPIPEVRARTSDLGAVGDTLAVSLVRAIAPELARSYQVVGDVGGMSFGAQREFLRGEAAFQQDAWALAEQHFERALDFDSTFALAAWRLANVKRWRRLPYDDDLRRLYDRQDARLRPLDRQLIGALREPGLRTRLARLDSVIARFPDDAYARLLNGEERFHRGPLVGRGLEQGIKAMADAVARDSSLALAYDHLVFGALRLGRRADAAKMLANRRRIGTAHSPGDPDVVTFAQLAYDERFVPWRAKLKRLYLGWTADSARLEGVSRVFRTGVPVFDIPESQVALSNLLLASRSDSADRAGSYRGKALGLMALGRPVEALALVDSAAAHRDSDLARLEQAEWWVVLPALGLPVPEARDWPARLAGLAADSTSGGRAAWALGFSAYARGDTLGGRQWIERLRTAKGLDLVLGRFLDAMALAARRQWEAALAASDSIENALNATDPPDPFARAAFHLQRGKWHAANGDMLGAEREWLWYEGSDVEGWPHGLAQAGEIDGMLSVYARLLRGRSLLHPGASTAERSAGCAHLRRVVELWAGAEQSFLRLREEAESYLRGCQS